MARTGGENVRGTDGQKDFEGEIILQKKDEVQDGGRTWRWTLRRSGSEAGVGRRRSVKKAEAHQGL